MTDDMLLENIYSDDKHALECLIQRYEDVVSMKANRFFMNGAERDDMIQEGRIGLYKAVKSYDLNNKPASFKTFANMCIERQLSTAVKNSNRQKHIPLNSSLSLNASAYDNNDDTAVIEVLDTNVTVDDPLEIITQKEYFKFIETKLEESLSDFEMQVLNRYKQGESYANIASKLDSKIKSVDTAIQRIRKKANKIKESLEYR
ncbi:RNA polymerase sigma-H factor [compost metagenome]